MKYLITLIAALLLHTSASAQFTGPYVPNPTPLNYLPNYYNRNNQPLSPYLNLYRGVNPGVNYYYGVRPGLPTGGVNVFGQAPMYQPFVGAAAGGFLPQAALPNDFPFDTAGKPVVLRSPSHPIAFGNQFANHGSFASVYAGVMNRAGQLPGGGLQRSTAQGVGNSPPRK